MPVLGLNACNSGSTTPSTIATPISVAIDTTRQPPFGLINVQVSGGESTPLVFDTGSPILVIESQRVGNVIYTGESLSITYTGGNLKVGKLAYGQVIYGGNSILTTSSQVPMIIVESGSFSESNAFYGILGEGQTNDVAPKLYLPYPYNQSFIYSKQNHSVTFGVFDTVTLNDFNQVQIPQFPESHCEYESYVVTKPNFNCYNDSAVPVLFNFGTQTSMLFNSLFDTGSENTRLNLPSLPNGYSTTVNNYITPNNITAILNQYDEPIPLTANIVYTQKSESVANMGAQVFNSKDLYSNQAYGIIGISK
jgi:hypothetical protein